MKTGIDCIGISTVFFCHDNNGNFLLHKRSKNCRDEQGKWDFGGGKLEFGLTTKENVLKEIQEEYGVLGSIQKELPYYNIFRENNGMKTHWISFPFIVEIDSNKAKNNEPENIEEIKWVKLQNLPQPLHPGVIFVLNKYKEEFENIGGKFEI